MAYRGTGVPKFGTGGVSYSMPTPIKGGRYETYEPIQEVYENILHKLIPGERTLRFVGEYEFSVVPVATLQLLITAYNMGRTVMWAPHGDIDKIRYEVVVEELIILPINGLIDFDGLTLKVRSVTTTNAIPTSDNMFRLGHAYPYLAATSVITGGAFVEDSEYAIRTSGNTDFVSIGATGVNATAFITGDEYLIRNYGTTNWVTAGANSSLATAIEKGVVYRIEAVGTTDFVTDFGASANTIGIEFIASADGKLGSGTGTAVGANFIAVNAGVGDGRVYDKIFTALGAGSGTGTAIPIEN